MKWLSLCNKVGHLVIVVTKLLPASYAYEVIIISLLLDGKPLHSLLIYIFWLLRLVKLCPVGSQFTQTKLMKVIEVKRNAGEPFNSKARCYLLQISF